MITHLQWLASSDSLCSLLPYSMHINIIHYMTKYYMYYNIICLHWLTFSQSLWSLLTVTDNEEYWHLATFAFVMKYRWW